MGIYAIEGEFSSCSSRVPVQAEQVPLAMLSEVVKNQKIADAEALLQHNGAQNVVDRTNAQGVN